MRGGPAAGSGRSSLAQPGLDAALHISEEASRISIATFNQLICQLGPTTLNLGPNPPVVPGYQIVESEPGEPLPDRWWPLTTSDLDGGSARFIGGLSYRGACRAVADGKGSREPSGYPNHPAHLGCGTPDDGSQDSASSRIADTACRPVSGLVDAVRHTRHEIDVVGSQNP